MRDVYDQMSAPSREAKAQPGWVLQGQLTNAQATAFGRPVAHGRSMSLVDAKVCSYDRGCDHNHGQDPFATPEFAANATVHDWNEDGWTTQQIRDSVAPTHVPVQCIYCTYSGDNSQHRCGARLYIEMPTVT